jgi:hypothetical protein
MEEDFPQSRFWLWRYSIWWIFSQVYKQCCNPDHDYRKMRETIEEYMWCSVYFEYRWSKNLTVCSQGNSLLCRVLNTAGGTLCGTSSSNEHYYSAGGASFCCATRWSNLSCPPAVSNHHARANCSAGNPPPRGNPGLKCTRTDAILK